MCQGKFKKLYIIMRYPNNPNLLKYISLSIVGTSAGWVLYQVKKTREILETAVDTSVLNLKPVIPEEGSMPEEFVDLQSFYPYNKSNIFKNTWDSLKFAYARRLVRLASSKDKTDRVKAVRHLVKIRNLNQWHYSLLANMIDSKTAIGLARSDDVDKRLLLEPPLRYHNYNRTMLISAMREFLINLHETSQHPCLGFFLSKVFVYEHDNSHIVDNDSSALELSKFIQSESDVLPKCLESLLHHASLEKYAKDIVNFNGLPLLMEIHHRYKNNVDITIKLCQILSFMSFDRSVLEPMHKSGWIGILSEWMKHADVRVSIPAARALANLDSDNEHLYSRRLYLLHPMRRTLTDQNIDVVFIHGLLGGVFYTWRQRNKSQNILSIIGKKEKKGINYETSLSMWASICPTEKVKFTLEERSDDLLKKLLDAGLGQRPIVWVTHSMGGLIVKNILSKAFDCDNLAVKNVCLNTRGIVFYSTPHNGSRLANLSQATALLLWPSVEVRELRENSPQLRKIHEKFLKIVQAVPMKIVTFVETKSTVVTAMKLNFLLVEPNSGNPGVGEYYEVPQDHLGICKPLTKHSFLYQKVLHILKDVLKENET
ncbi:protein SERAC1 isoform X2 [Leptinotarsa decemlineata]|uniref:protein SERAC1 isoform X2 n=1 Tax=Leptinotarsa decemlineata TaxID=7539 RepID=UPI003D309BD3